LNGKIFQHSAPPLVAGSVSPEVLRKHMIVKHSLR